MRLQDKAQAYSKGGHTDFGSLTLLFSQHVAGLQIRTPEGEWKYVKPVSGGITCNAADTLSFLTNGKHAPHNHIPSNFARLCEIHDSPRGHPTERSNRHTSPRPSLFQ